MAAAVAAAAEFLFARCVVCKGQENVVLCVPVCKHPVCSRCARNALQKFSFLTREGRASNLGLACPGRDSCKMSITAFSNFEAASAPSQCQRTCSYCRRSGICSAVEMFFHEKQCLDRKFRCPRDSCRRFFVRDPTLVNLEASLESGFKKHLESDCFDGRMCALCPWTGSAVGHSDHEKDHKATGDLIKDFRDQFDEILQCMTKKKEALREREIQYARFALDEFVRDLQQTIARWFVAPIDATFALPPRAVDGESKTATPAITYESKNAAASVPCEPKRSESATELVQPATTTSAKRPSPPPVASDVQASSVWS